VHHGLAHNRGCNKTPDAWVSAAYISLWGAEEDWINATNGIQESELNVSSSSSAILQYSDDNVASNATVGLHKKDTLIVLSSGLCVKASLLASKHICVGISKHAQLSNAEVEQQPLAYCFGLDRQQGALQAIALSAGTAQAHVHGCSLGQQSVLMQTKGFRFKTAAAYAAEQFPAQNQQHCWLHTCCTETGMLPRYAGASAVKSWALMLMLEIPESTSCTTKGWLLFSHVACTSSAV